MVSTDHSLRSLLDHLGVLLDHLVGTSARWSAGLGVLLAGSWVGARHHGWVEILLWWLPPAIVTLIAMLWVSWLGRARDLSPDRSDAAQERFAAAILRELPSEVTSRVSAPRPLRERSTGIAVRPSQKPIEPDEGSRRSA